MVRALGFLLAFRQNEVLILSDRIMGEIVARMAQ